MGSMDGPGGGWMDVCEDDWEYGWVDEFEAQWMGGWTSTWKDEQVDSWINGRVGLMANDDCVGQSMNGLDVWVYG